MVVLDTGDVKNSDVETCFANLLDGRYKELYKHRLVICNISVTDTIKTYKLDLPGNVTTKRKLLQATQLKSEEKFAKAANFSIPYREEQVKKIFSNEVTNFPSALTEGGPMYHSSKSDLLERLKQILEVILEPPLEEKNAMVVDLSVVVNALSNRRSIKPKAFQ